MGTDRLQRLRVAAAIAMTAVVGLLTFSPAGAAQAATYVPLSGAGSTYAYPALNQWATDLEPQGLHLNFDPNGSAQGRQQYIANQKDYAGSDIAFVTNGNADPFDGVDTGGLGFAYSYIPDVAGGLSFMYNLQVQGHKITNMRLSGKTLAEIFTGHIKNWDDPAITHDYGKRLPSLPITVVTRSDGAGESYFLSNWLNTDYRSLWVPFCTAHGGPPHCGIGPTEQYPDAGFTALSGSDTLSAYIQSPTNNGAIGYAEQAYAQEYHLPTVSMLNAAGYYVGPTASNVAIALEAAKINPDQNSVNFLMQDLTKVYTDKDPRTYPLSAYSYLVVPRNSRAIGGRTFGPQPEFNTAKGKSLSTYVNYILCGAQASAANLGYSPLPKPMVQGGFRQEGFIPGGVKSPAASNYNNCNNPAFHNGVDVLTRDAPFPSACQKVGAPLDCTLDKKGRPVSSNSPGSNGPGSHGPGAGGPNSGPNGTGGPNGGASGSNVKIDPNTGQVESGSGFAAASDVNAQPVGFAGRPAEQWLFGVLTALLLAAAVVVPTLLGTWLQRSRPGGGER